MHYVHGILVKLDERQLDLIEDFNDLSPDDIDELEKEIRSTAMSETECYAGQAYDWREDTSAGRWSGTYPGNGVILGYTKPDYFLKELKEFSDLALTHALEAINRVIYRDWKWRSEEQINSISGCRKMPNPFYPDGKDGEYLSAVYVGPPQIDEEWIKKAMTGTNMHMDVFSLWKVMNLVMGYYDCDSQFYSLPDYEARISETTLEDVTKNPGHYALVISDYHN